MSMELQNVTQSRNFQDRVFFEVDARHLSEALLDDLSDRVDALVFSEEDGHFFDQSFQSFAHVAAVVNPLKFQVLPPLPHRGTGLRMFSSSAPPGACMSPAARGQARVRTPVRAMGRH